MTELIPAGPGADVLLPHHRELLLSSAIDIELAVDHGVRSVSRRSDFPEGLPGSWTALVPALLFPWYEDLDTTREGALWQIRPDTPPVDGEGRPMKYLFPKGTETVVSAVLERGDGGMVVLAEGTKQPLAVASAAPDGVSVYGVAGCWSWASVDFHFVAGRVVVIMFDADMRENLNVYNAAERLRDTLLAFGAAEVRFARVPDSVGKGVDDFLAVSKIERRAEIVGRLTGAMSSKALGKKPTLKQTAVAVNPVSAAYFDAGRLKVDTLVRAIDDEHPLAMTAEEHVAVYRGGVFNISDTAINGAVVEKLVELFTNGHLLNVKSYAKGLLYNEQRILPIHTNMPILNVRNGMLDLVRGELLVHDPGYLSTTQLPVEWDEGAGCPTYESWLMETVGGQWEDLEEAVSTMLDPSRTPSKAVFLFGPSRSGKSTFLRLMMAIAGQRNTSAITLHQLANDPFAAANVFGKVLNSAADISAKHVEDMSFFKMLVGEDPIPANRKFGAQFTFTNRALFAFSANELPTVSESSRAYVERIKPFLFGKSFAGNEDPTIEDRMMCELPGILARWVRAWQARQVRGVPLQTDRFIRAQFESRSDRVRQWLSEECEVVRMAPDGRLVEEGMRMPPGSWTTPRMLSQRFNRWAEITGGSRMGERKVLERLELVEGVFAVRGMPNSVRAYNVIVRENDGVWLEESVEVAKVPREDVGALTNADIVVAGVVVDLHVEDPQGSAELDGANESAPEGDNDGLAGHLQAQGALSNPIAHVRKKEEVVSVKDSVVKQCSVIGLESAPGVESAPGRIVPAPTGLPSRLSLDIETHDADLMFTASPFLRLAGFSFDRGPVQYTTDGQVLADLLSPKVREIIGHNLMGFDIVALAAHYQGVDLHALAAAGSLKDTKLMAALADPPEARMKDGEIERRYSLNNVATAFLGEQKNGNLKALAKEFGGYGDIPVDDSRYVEYLEQDVLLVDKLADFFPHTPYSLREHRVAAIAAQVTINGFKVDVELLNERYEAGEAKRRQLVNRLQAEYGLPTKDEKGVAYKAPQNTTVGRAAVKAAFEAAGAPHMPKTPAGAWATGADAMTKMTEVYGHLPEVVELIEVVSSLNGVRSVYGTVKQYLNPDGWVHPSVSMKQASGRWSLTKPGLTVMGKRGGRSVERDVFVADNEDHVLIAADLSQIDARAIAVHSQDPNYLALFVPGIDSHVEIAKMVWGDASRRSDAKAIGHGWNYGMGISGLVKNAGVTEEVATQFDEAMRAQFPRLIEWRDEIREEGESGRLLDNGFGRLMRCDPDRAWTQAPALIGQGCARDLLMEGLLRLPTEILPMIKAVVHDEIVLSVPRSQVAEVEQVALEALHFWWAPAGMSREVEVTASLGEARAASWGRVYVKAEK